MLKWFSNAKSGGMGGVTQYLCEMSLGGLRSPSALFCAQILKSQCLISGSADVILHLSTHIGSARLRKSRVCFWRWKTPRNLLFLWTDNWECSTGMQMRTQSRNYCSPHYSTPEGLRLLVADLFAFWFNKLQNPCLPPKHAQAKF